MQVFPQRVLVYRRCAHSGWSESAQSMSADLRPSVGCLRAMRAELHRDSDCFGRAPLRKSQPDSSLRGDPNHRTGQNLLKNLSPADIFDLNALEASAEVDIIECDGRENEVEQTTADRKPFLPGLGLTHLGVHLPRLLRPERQARMPSTMLSGHLVGTTRVSFNRAAANNPANSSFVRSRPPMMSI